LGKAGNRFSGRGEVHARLGVRLVLNGLPAAVSRRLFWAIFPRCN
jgi:hypothetical protein